ncbi:MAG: hypothetical protein JWR72_696 [Flavisolibacter sp.]|jgi:SAM-dependent methyltransferase|nr:hypothetical protein [Flavisolibacter sp.]
MIESFPFNGYSQYYDAFYNDKDYSGEVNRIVSIIRSLHPTAQSMLELGCGTGNHAAFLSKLGFRITGIDRSDEMVRLASSKAIENFQPVVADIRNFELDQKFDVSLSLFHVMSYLTDNRDLISCLRCVNNHLHNDGLFLFDAWYSPAIHHQQPEVRTRHSIKGHLELERLAEPVSIINRNVVNVHYKISVRDTIANNTKVINENHSMRHFSIPEIGLLAEFTGFQLVDVQELLSGKEPRLDSWAICFVLKKSRDCSTC